MRLIGVLLTVMLLGGCASISDVGTGMKTGGMANMSNPLSGVFVGVGMILEAAGGDGNSIQSKPVMQSRWGLAHRCILSPKVESRLDSLNNSGDVVMYNEFNGLISLCCEQAITKQFNLPNDKIESLRNQYMDVSEPWISIQYQNKNGQNSLVMYCSKGDVDCRIALPGESIKLPDTVAERKKRMAALGVTDDD